MELVSILENEVRLNSNMTERAFGKTNYNDIVSQKGLAVECKKESEGNYSFVFSDWSFSDIKAFEVKDENGSPLEERKVFYCGKSVFSNPENVFTLNELYETAGNSGSSKDAYNRMFEASYILCSVITKSAKENLQLPLNGSGGILFEIESDRTVILFLPENLFKYSVGSLSKVEYSNLQGCWMNPTLYDLPALCFYRSVIAYKMISGRFPFTSSDPVERNADILDRRFLPIDLCVNGINAELAAEINKGLKLTSNSVAIPGKKKKGKSSEDLTPSKDFPLNLLYNFKNEPLVSKLSDEQFNEKSQSYMKKRDSIVKTKRNIRRNTSAIIAGIIICGFVYIFINSLVKSDLDSVTSKGLTSVETLQGYFYGVNQRDSVLLSNFSEGKRLGQFNDSISSIYVLDKQRQAYSHDQGFLNVEGWLFWSYNEINDKYAGLYGITNVTIDGTPVEINIKLPLKKDKPEPLTEEKGITLNNKIKSVHTVEFYLLHTEGEDNHIEIDRHTMTITLTFKKDRWILTDLQAKDEPVKFDSHAFKQEYYDTVARNNKNIYKSVSQLRYKYDWLPSEKALQEEEKRIIEKNKIPFVDDYNQFYENK